MECHLCEVQIVAPIREHLDVLYGEVVGRVLIRGWKLVHLVQSEVLVHISDGWVEIEVLTLVSLPGMSLTHDDLVTSGLWCLNQV